MSEISKEFEIVNDYGFHARPAASFVRTASKFSSEITVEKDGISVSGKSIMGLLTIEGHQGSIIKITASGDDAEEALSELGKLVNDKFNE